MNLTERQFAAAQRYPWLRAAYYHADMVGQVVNSSAVAADANTVTPGTAGVAPLDYPDALLGGTHPVDVVPETEVSERAHLGRSGIVNAEQLITYPPATDEFLAEVFR